MRKHPGQQESVPIKILWANAYCLMDTTSGASMAVNEILKRLAMLGYEIRILGATVFDDPKGYQRLMPLINPDMKNEGKIVRAVDKQLTHELLVTKSTARDAMTAFEENLLWQRYHTILDEFSPDILFYYGGYPFDALLAADAKARGMRTVAYLGNVNYSGTRWCRDVDLILTDSQATASYYRESYGYDVTPIGTFIDPGMVVSTERTPNHLLFINPSLSKGAAFVAQIAIILEQQRPDIKIEVVESRGDWSAVVKAVSSTFGQEVYALPNVIVTPNTNDMRPIYGRAKLLLAPSFAWESAGRVIAEAMLNGVPAIVTNRGGPPEVMGSGGITVTFPKDCYEAPYVKLPGLEKAQQLANWIIDIWDNPKLYNEYSQRAYQSAVELHDIHANSLRLSSLLKSFLNASVDKNQEHNVEI